MAIATLSWIDESHLSSFRCIDIGTRFQMNSAIQKNKTAEPFKKNSAVEMD